MRDLILTRRQVGLGPLILVNASHPVRPEALRPARLAPALGAPDILMEAGAAALLQALVAAVGGEGKILPVSGWRSGAEQQQIWDDTLAKDGEAFTRPLAAPGCAGRCAGPRPGMGSSCATRPINRPLPVLRTSRGIFDMLGFLMPF